MRLPQKLPEFILVAGVCLLIGYGTGAVLGIRKHAMKLGDTIAVAWSDGALAGPIYGAHVYLDPYMDGETRGHAVRVRVFIGRDKRTQQFTARHELGVVKTPAEAIAKWGRAHWAADGLRVGTAPGKEFFLPKEKLVPER